MLDFAGHLLQDFDRTVKKIIFLLYILFFFVLIVCVLCWRKLGIFFLERGERGGDTVFACDAVAQKVSNKKKNKLPLLYKFI